MLGSGPVHKGIHGDEVGPLAVERVVLICAQTRKKKGARDGVRRERREGQREGRRRDREGGEMERRERE